MTHGLLRAPNVEFMQGVRARIARDGVTVLAVVFAAAAVVEDLVTPHVTIDGRVYDRGPEVVIITALVAMTVLLAFRHRLGLASPLLAVAVCAAATLPARAWVLDASVFFLFAMLLCGIAGYLSRSPRAMVMSLGALWALAAVAEWSRPASSIRQFFFVIIDMTIGWLAGMLIRRPVARAQSAEERAVQVEADRALAVERAAAEERQRIARELHDIVAHSVSMMTVQAGAVRRLLTPEQERERAALVRIEETGRDAMGEMRRLVGLLKADDPSLVPQPGLASLDVLCAKVRDAGLPVEVRVVGDALVLPPGLDLTAYRIVQEALTNALKYAGPARACVTLTWSDCELVIEVTNDGESREQGEAAGFGQAGMRERLALYGGRLSSGPGPSGGYAVRAVLPLETAS